MGRPKGSKNKPKVDDSPIKINNRKKTNPSRLDSKVKPSIDTPQGTKTVAEIKDNLNKYEYLKETFATTSNALQLVDLTKTESRTYSSYSRETLRTYLKSPKSYESQIRNLSKFLYRLCYEYKRICTFYASMICGDAFNIIPLINPTEETNPEEVMANFYETMTYWQRMQFCSEVVKLLLVAWREDAIYAYIYDDSDQEGGTCFFHILDGDYCRVSSIENGVCRFAFDFSYFRSHKTELEYLDSEFESKYNAFDKDSSLKWQELDPSRQICLKVNIDDPTMTYPPFAQLFEKIISLLDLQAIQSVKDELSAYKLLVARLETVNGSDEPDNFQVDINTAIEYYNKFANSLPEFVSACISPLPIESIEFKNLNTTSDTDMLSMAMSNIFKSVGGVILGSDKTGTTIYEAQIIADMEIAQATLLPQIERWINLYLDYKIGDGHAIVKYIKGVSPYTRSKKRKELLESAQNGLPTKMEVSILDGKSPLETISQLYFENEVLGLPQKMMPLSTSYTQSGNSSDPISGGAPTKDSTELTDEGSKSREK